MGIDHHPNPRGAVVSESITRHPPARRRLEQSVDELLRAPADGTPEWYQFESNALGLALRELPASLADDMLETASGLGGLSSRVMPTSLAHLGNFAICSDDAWWRTIATLTTADDPTERLLGRWFLLQNQPFAAVGLYEGLTSEEETWSQLCRDALTSMVPYYEHYLPRLMERFRDRPEGRAGVLQIHDRRICDVQRDGRHRNGSPERGPDATGLLRSTELSQHVLKPVLRCADGTWIALTSRPSGSLTGRDLPTRPGGGREALRAPVGPLSGVAEEKSGTDRSPHTREVAGGETRRAHHQKRRDSSAFAVSGPGEVLFRVLSSPGTSRASAPGAPAAIWQPLDRRAAQRGFDERLHALTLWPVVPILKMQVAALFGVRLVLHVHAVDCRLDGAAAHESVRDGEHCRLEHDAQLRVLNLIEREVDQLPSLDDAHHVGVVVPDGDAVGLEAEATLYLVGREVKGDRERLGLDAVCAADLDGDARADDARVRPVSVARSGCVSSSVSMIFWGEGRAGKATQCRSRSGRSQRASTRQGGRRGPTTTCDHPPRRSALLSSSSSFFSPEGRQ
jgi:hypothetical protein